MSGLRRVHAGWQPSGAKTLGSLFDVPLQLIAILTLATTDVSAPPRVEVSAVVAPSDPDPYRFGEQRWLAALFSGAGGEGLDVHRARVFRTSGGRFYVPAASERTAIMALRSDPDVAGLVAFDLARRHAVRLGRDLQRPATAIDLYLAHALDVDTALRFLFAVRDRPKAPAAELLAGSASAVPAGKDGGGRSVAAVYERLARIFGPAAGTSALAAVPSAPGEHGWRPTVVDSDDPAAEDIDRPRVEAMSSPGAWTAVVH